MNESLIVKAVNTIDPSFDDSSMSVSGWLSVPTVDTDSEIIDGSAFDCSMVHKRFPWLLWGHKRDRLPLGRYEDSSGNYTLTAKAYPTGGNGLYGTAYFSKANPEGEIVYGMYREGMLKGFSAGFVPRQSRMEKIGGQSVRRFTEAVLFEGSAVPIPANLDATASMIGKGMLNGVKLPAWLAAELLTHIPEKNTFSASLLAQSAKQCGDSVHSRASEKTMAEVTAETISEAMKLKEADEAREKQFGELVEFKANAETLLNELNDKIEKQATEIESLKGGFVPRDEYDADVVKLQGAIEATGKVKFGD